VKKTISFSGGAPAAESEEDSIDPLPDGEVAELIDEGKFDEALKVSEAALESAHMQAEEGGAEALEAVASAQLLVAEVYFRQGNREQAEREYKEIIEQVDRHGLAGELKAQALASTAAIAEQRGIHSHAVKGYEEAIRIWEEANPDDVEEITQLRNNLGMIYKDEGDYGSAEEHFVTGIERLESQLGRYNETIAALYNNLSTLYHAVGHLENARGMAVRALDIRQQILSPNHPDSAQSFSNLGSISYALDDLDAALDNFARAVAILEELDEADPQEYEIVVSNYIDLLNHVGESEKAAGMTRKARRVYAKLMDSQI